MKDMEERLKEEVKEEIAKLREENKQLQNVQNVQNVQNNTKYQHSCLWKRKYRKIN